MIHQVMGGMEGQASDIKIRAERILKIKDNLNKIMSKHSGKNLQQVEKDTDRDNFMSAEQALAYGLIDKVIEK